MTKPIKTVFRAAVSFSLLYYFLANIDISSMRSIFKSALNEYLFLSFLVIFCGFILSCHKWRMLLRADNISCPFPILARYYLIGIYSNNFLPTSIGGDAFRMYLVSRYSGNSNVGIGSVVAERLSGVFALMLLGLLGTCLVPSVFSGRGWVFFAGALAAVALFLAIAEAARFRIPADRLGNNVWAGKAIDVLGGIRRYFTTPATLWTMVWTSFAFQSLMVLAYFLAAKALSLQVPLPVMLAVVPLVTLLTLLPVSLNGLGLREGGFVLLLGEQGIPQVQALSLSLAVFGLSLLFGLAGGVCLLFERGRAARP